MDNTQWLLNEIEQAKQSSSKYQDQAFYLSLQDLVREQAKRIEQAEGELDGRMWNVGRW